MKPPRSSTVLGLALQELTEAMGDTRERVARVEEIVHSIQANVGEVKSEMARRNGSIERLHADYEQRFRSLEGSRERLLGAAAVAGGAAGLFFQAIAWIFRR